MPESSTEFQESHAAGLVHGDLTPHNVVVTRDSRGRLHARLLGIGAMSLLRAHPGTSAHATHKGSGKFAISYMAPESLGDRPTASSDLYAIGTLIHHMLLGSPPVGWEGAEAFEDLPAMMEVVERARHARPNERYESAAAMRAALDWVEVESSKRNPHTQDIAPWMETSYVGSIPVPVLASSFPPAQRSSLHAPGTVLSGPPVAEAPRPTAPPGNRPRRDRRWLQLALLLCLLGTLVLFGSWHNAQSSDALGSFPESRSTESAGAE
jgi:serine/threonine protein kinase